MPELYRGVCSHCDYRTAIMTGGYGAVLVDQPPDEFQSEVAGACLFSDARGEMAEAADPRFVALAHPLESTILADTGYTWRDLFWQGRYVSVTNVVCRHCGRTFQKRQLAAPADTGCTTAILIGVTVGIAAGVITRSFVVAFASCFAATCAAASAAMFLADFYIRRRFPQRAAALAAEFSCPACSADDSIEISRARSVRCPACREEKQSFETAGIS